MAAYVAAVEQEGGTLPETPLRTLYVGGGTPTALPRDLLWRLLDGLRRRFITQRSQTAGRDAAEFTVEANPGVLDDALLDAMQNAGVNRVSLGVQSFHPETLATLGRIHGPDEALRALDLLRRRGIRHVSLDLMFAVPGQPLDQWLSDLRAAVACDVEHLSVYGLSIEPHTPLGRRVAAGDLAPLPDATYAEMQMAARHILLAAGYEHYELSNFARPGCRCRHNLAYWHNHSYLALGPAATSYVGGVRETRIADVAEYVRRVQAGASPVAESERLTGERRARETAILGLRLLEGFDIAAFERQTGFAPLYLFAEPIKRHRDLGLLEVADGHVRLTPAALPVADSVLADFV
jgi:oxygen-independent coproporphyrinogen-3 oxidase